MNKEIPAASISARDIKVPASSPNKHRIPPQRAASMPEHVRKRLLPNNWPEWLVSELRQRIEQFIPSMRTGHSYLLETICGNAYWNKLSPAQRTQAGKAMAKLVAAGFFELDFASNDHGQTKMYQLK